MPRSDNVEFPWVRALGTARHQQVHLTSRSGPLGGAALSDQRLSVC